MFVTVTTDLLLIFVWISNHSLHAVLAYLSPIGCNNNDIINYNIKKSHEYNLELFSSFQNTNPFLCMAAVRMTASDMSIASSE